MCNRVLICALIVGFAFSTQASTSIDVSAFVGEFEKVSCKHFYKGGDSAESVTDVFNLRIEAIPEGLKIEELELPIYHMDGLEVRDITYPVKSEENWIPGLTSFLVKRPKIPSDCCSPITKFKTMKYFVEILFEDKTHIKSTTFRKGVFFRRIEHWTTIEVTDVGLTTKDGQGDEWFASGDGGYTQCDWRRRK